MSLNVNRTTSEVKDSMYRRLKNMLEMTNDNTIKALLLFFSASVIVFIQRIVWELPNPDAVGNTIYKSGWGDEFKAGRYGIRFLQELRLGFVNTSFATVLSLFFLSFTYILLIKLFEIRQRVWQIVVGALLIVSPFVGSTLSYYYCSDMYFLSCFFSVAAIYILAHMQGKKYVAFSALLLCLSCCIYQGYLSLAITLCLMFLIKMLIDKEDIKQALMQAMRFLTGGICGILLYFVSSKLIQKWSGVSATDDRGFSRMGQISLSQLPSQIKGCYYCFIDYFFRGTFIYNYFGGRRTINFIFFLILIVLLLLILCTKRTWVNRILLVGMVLCVPISTMSILILAPEVSISGTTGCLILPAMNCVYMLGILFLKGLEKENVLGLKSSIVLLTASIAVCWMLLLLELAGQTYIKHYVKKTNTVAGLMIREIEDAVDNSNEYRLCIAGTMESGNFPDLYRWWEQSLHWTSMHQKTIWVDYYNAQRCWCSWMANYCGKSYSQCGMDEYDRLKEEGFFDNMPCFPDEGSVVVRGDIIVIKLGDSIW